MPIRTMLPLPNPNNYIRGLLHKTFTREKINKVKSENVGKHNFTIDFTMIGEEKNSG